MLSICALLTACSGSGGKDSDPKDSDPKDSDPKDSGTDSGTDDSGTDDSGTTDDTRTVEDADGDGSPAGEDCDDGDPSVNPGAAEICDGKDDDCDGLSDDANDSVTGTSTFYSDADGDGDGDPATAIQACAGAGWTADSSDHDDTDPAVWLAPDTFAGTLSSGFAGFCTGYGRRRIQGGLALSIATQADVDGLSALSSIGGTLAVSGNASLTGVDGLSALTSVGGDLSMYQNTALCESSADALVARLEGSGYAGSTTVIGTDPGC